jgi:hypothetical protein
MYTPTWMRGADGTWQTGQMENQNLIGGFSRQVAPDLSSAYQNLQGINYQPYLQASQQAGQQYGQLADTAGGYGGLEFGSALNAFGQQQGLQQAGQQVYNLGMDPRNEQYQKGLQQTQDQSNAINSMYGLGASGAGAGMTQQASQNYNTDWQNQQLQRGLSGLQGLTQANQAGGQLGTLGSAQLQSSLGYYGQMPGYTQQSAQTPISAQQYAYGQPYANIGAYSNAITGAMAPYQQLQSQATQYMGLGGGLQSSANTANLQNRQFQAQQQAGALQSLGNVDWGQLSQSFNQQPYNYNAQYNPYDSSSAGFVGPMPGG